MVDDNHPKDGRSIVSFEELGHSNALIVEALVGLLAEKGVITREDLIGRVKQLRRETKVQSTGGPADQVVVTRADLISSNSFVAELLLDLLVEKGFLNAEEMVELKTRMKDRTRKLLQTQ
jgi:hypothetical protein